MTSSPTCIGSYLDRKVWCAVLDGDAPGLDLGHYLVLLDLDGAPLPEDAQTQLATRLVALRPLGVFVTGAAAEAMFESLTMALAAPAPSLQMMMGYSTAELPDAIEAFLQSTVPYEEAWDQWRGYALLSLHGSAERLQRAAEPFVEP